MAYFDPAGARGWLVAVRESGPPTLRKAKSRRILCPACETSVAIPQRVAQLEFPYQLRLEAAFAGTDTPPRQ